MASFCRTCYWRSIKASPEAGTPTFGGYTTTVWVLPGDIELKNRGEKLQEILAMLAGAATMRTHYAAIVGARVTWNWPLTN